MWCLFGPKRDEIIGSWRKLHNEELRNLYSTPDTIRMIKSRRMRWTGYAACMGEESIQGFGRQTRRKERPLGRISFRWEDNIEVDFRVIGYGGPHGLDSSGSV
jgi:hypothetical protein